MSRKQFIIITTLLVLVAGLGILIISKRNTAPDKPVQETSVLPSPTLAPVTLLTWTDEAGFSFQYPEGTTIDKHLEDTANYANLTLTLPSQDSVDIKMSDDTFKDLNSWVGENSALDATLDDRPAKKIMKDSKEVIACIDNGVIVTITGNNLSGIANSWKFIYPSPSASKNTNTVAGSEDVDVLEEE